MESRRHRANIGGLRKSGGRKNCFLKKVKGQGIEVGGYSIQLVPDNPISHKNVFFVLSSFPTLTICLLKIKSKSLVDTFPRLILITFLGSRFIKNKSLKSLSFVTTT
jgi:hypothetical protein